MAIVVAILAVLAVVGGGIGIFALTQGGDDDTDTASTTESSSELPATTAPTSTSEPPSLATSAAPPTAPTDFSLSSSPTNGLPTEGGPSQAQYFSVADKFVSAVQKGDCKTARALTTSDLKSMSDEVLCRGTTGDAIANDQLDQHKLTTFGTYGAAVYYDGERTFISLVAQQSSPPLIDAVIAY